MSETLERKLREAEADCVRRQAEKVEMFKRAERAEAALATARKDALEEAAKVCVAAFDEYGAKRIRELKEKP